MRLTKPDGGEAVTMMRTADVMKSDADLAGLSLRCDDKQLEAMLIVVEPFPPRAKLAVSLAGPGGPQRFEATVLPPGAAVLLPAEATELIRGPWQSLPTLAVEIERADRKVKGSIPLAGLASAVQTLNCALQ